MSRNGTAALLILLLATVLLLSGAIDLYSWAAPSASLLLDEAQLGKALVPPPLPLPFLASWRGQKDDLCSLWIDGGDKEGGGKREEMMEKYNQLPDTLINVDWDVARGSGASSSLPAEIVGGDAECIAACELHPNCTAAVVDRRNGGACLLTRGPAQSLSRSNGFVSYVRKNVAVTFHKDHYFTSRIVFGMLAAPQYLASRAAAALSTWLCSYSVLLLIEDIAGSQGKFAAMLASLPAACRAGKIARFRSVPDRSFNGAWKDIPLTRLLVEAYPGRDWYAIVDDDTFVLMHNLNLELSTFYSSDEERRRPSCIGVEFTVAGDRSLSFPQGGAGIFLNRPAASALAAAADRCTGQCKQRMGDVRLGCCMKLCGVPIRNTDTLWSRSPFLAVGVDQRMNHAAFPTSFHQMRRIEWTYDLTSWSAGVLSDLGASCTPSSAYAKTQMCVLYSLQQQHCTKGGRGRSGGGVALSVPLTWDVLAHHLKVEQQHDAELFEYELR